VIYNTGTVNVVEGSRTIVGVGTAFIKYVDVGALFKVLGDFDYYSVLQVIDDVTLLLDRNYGSVSKNLQQFSINPDRTPNLNLPLVGRNDPDAARTVNIALGMIDRNVGGLMDFTPLASYTASGEKHGFIFNDYHDTFLQEGRVVAFQNSSNEVVGYNKVLHNTLFDAQINIAPSGENVFYDGGSLSVTVPKKWDILNNQDSYGYAFIKSADMRSPAGCVTISGEIMFSDGVWDNNDRIAVFAQTHGLGQIQSVSSSGEVVVSVQGETIVPANFVAGMSLYNYKRNNSRTIVSAGGTPLVVTNVSSVDDWVEGDIVYTLKQKLEFEVTGISANASVICYGAKSTISADGVKKEHIDFGTGFNQVGAADLPLDIPAIPRTDTQEAIHYAYDAFTNHVASGEAHLATAVRYQDDLQGAFAMSASNLNDAVNELKARVNAGVILNGTISSGESKTGFFCADYISTPTNFLGGEWWCRFENGSAIGNVRKVTDFNSVTGHFTVSGECSYIPETNTDFLLMNINTPSYFNITTAKGNGTIDDTLAIQADIQKIESSGKGGILYFPPGVYKLTSTIRIKQPNVSIQGSGYGTDFRCTGDYGDVFDCHLDVDPVEGGATLGLSGLRFTNFQMTTTVTRTSGAAIYAKYTHDAQFTNIAFSDSHYGSPNPYSFYDGIRLVYQNSAVLMHICGQCTHHGVYMSGTGWATYQFSYDGYIGGYCKLFGASATGNGIFMDSNCGGVQIDAVSIAHFVVGIRASNCREIFLGHGFGADVCSSHGIYISDCNLLEIGNNWSAGNTGSGIKMENIAQVNITGGNYYLNGSYGFEFVNCYSIVISGGCTLSSNTSGDLSIDSGTEYLTVVGNQFGSTPAITSAAAGDVRIMGNAGTPDVFYGGLIGTKTYYVANSSGGSPTRKLTFTNGILTSET
jgi:hypothetical protein